MNDCSPTQPNSTPIQNIINLTLAQVYSQTEDHLLKNYKTGKTDNCQIHENDMEAKKREVQTECTQRTVQTAKDKLKYQLASAKSIKDEAIPPPDQPTAPTALIFTSLHQTCQISRTIRFSCPFTQLTQLFLEKAQKHKMTKCQDTQNFVTVKKGGNGACHCLWKMWTGDGDQGEVYQLRKRNGDRAKMILIEGDKTKFYRFYYDLLQTLSSQHISNLLPIQKVQLLFFTHSQTNQISKISTNLLRKLSKNKHIPQQHIQQLSSELQKEIYRMKRMICNDNDDELRDLSAMEKIVQELCFENSGVEKVYQQIYRRQYEMYRGRREQLLKMHPMSELFRQLEISQHFNQFKRLRSLKQIDPSQQIPYQSCIKTLKTLSNSHCPTTILQFLLLFHTQIRKSYQQYFKTSTKTGDMDDFLPVTIFCVLAVENQINWLGNIKFMLGYILAMEKEQGEKQWVWEKKTLTDIQAAFQYINHQWQENKVSQ